MSKIMVIGCGGAGKSTFSRQLQQATGLRLIHLDRHYWQPNWMETSKEAWKAKVIQLANEESWIIDGNYGGTMEIRFDKADTIVFLDRSKWLCLYRVTKRLIQNYGRTRSDMGEDCQERFSWEFMKYVYHYNRTRKPKILDQLDKLKTSKEVFILKNEREIKAFLQTMKTNTSDLNP